VPWTIRVYRLALRMTARRPDAEDATQEILIRVITRLSTFRGEAAFGTWVHRITVNHLLDRSRSGVERMELTFDRFAADLLDGLSAGPSADPDAGLLESEPSQRRRRRRARRLLWCGPVRTLRMGVVSGRGRSIMALSVDTRPQKRRPRLILASRYGEPCTVE
jgi:DNA-directed RNA polymerase specialized sigma24 family protein